MPLDGAGLAAIGRSGRSVWVFLGMAVLPRNLPNMPIGFSWISLDSLVRIETFQWVTRQKRAKVFSVAPLGVERAGDGDRSRAYAEAQNCSRGKLSLVSDSTQRIVVPALSFSRRLIQKPRDLGQRPIGAVW